MLRLALPPDDVDDETEESVTVAEAARLLGGDEATIRAMLRNGELTGHRLGKGKKGCQPRGVRVHLSSIRRYKRRNIIGASPPAANDPGPQPAKTVHTSSAIQATRRLRALGLIR